MTVSHAITYWCLTGFSVMFTCALVVKYFGQELLKFFEMNNDIGAGFSWIKKIQNESCSKSVDVFSRVITR